MRILVVEDDPQIASFITTGLQQAGFAVDHAADGDEGLHLAVTEPYDAVVVDVMLPKRDGLSVVEELRRRKINTPVLILSARRSVDDRIKGLQKGGDDYLTKPFAFAELLARVQALIRRAHRETELTSITSGDMTLDLLTREVTRAGQRLELQPREFALLEYLMCNAGRVISKTMILEHVCLEESDRILSMLNTLMDISEAEHGAMRLERERLSAQALILQAVELYRDVAEDKGIHLSTTVPSELCFSADRNRMLQVMTNLLDNAIKHPPSGGQVTITAASNYDRIVLADARIGISPEDLPHIWDRLYRGDKSRSQRGLGLGLSLVKALVQAHNGSVTALSTPSNGAVFTVALPLRPLPPA